MGDICQIYSWLPGWIFLRTGAQFDTIDTLYEELLGSIRNIIAFSAHYDGADSWNPFFLEEKECLPYSEYVFSCWCPGSLHRNTKNQGTKTAMVINYF